MEQQVTQHLSINVQNNLSQGDITIKNTVTVRYLKYFHRWTRAVLTLFENSGQPYDKSEKLKLLSPEDLNEIVIPHAEKGTICFCGSASYGVGIEGSLDLYRGNKGRIASLHWKGPWARVGNRFDVTNVDCETYLVTVSPIHNSGVLGDVTVIVADIGR